MAREKDITRRPKFFTRKRGVTDEQLCDKCRHHNFVIMARYGCDALILTDAALRTRREFAVAAADNKYLHLWCTRDDEAPKCLYHFREAGVVQ